MKISCKHKSMGAQRAIKEAHILWLQFENRKWYTRRYYLGQHLKVMHMEMHKRYHNIMFDYTTEKIHEEVRKDVFQQYRKQQRKLQQLRIINQTGQNTNTNGQQTTPHVFYDRVVNLSGFQFNNEEIKLLNKGLKYSPNTTSRREYELLAIDTEIALNNTEDNDHIRYACAETIQKGYRISNKHRKHTETQCIKSIRRKCQEEGLTICQADKGNTIVILKQEEYHRKVEEFIKANKLTKLNKDPTTDFQKSLTSTVKKCNTLIPEDKIYMIRTTNPQAPLLYGTVKLHKEGKPIRPVVSYINAPTYNLCKYLNKLLPDKIDCNSKYAIKNSVQFVEKTKKLEIPRNAKLISFDVKSLFTSIPIKDLQDVISQKIKTTQLPKKEKEELKILTNTCMMQNYCRFEEEFYLQNDGLPMGSPLSPLLTEIYMAEFERRLFEKTTSKRHIQFWCRYVDDIFCVWLGTERQLKGFLSELNDVDKNIQFTMEIQCEGKLNFLDLQLSTNEGSIQYNIYRKPTTTDAIIPNNSKQSITIKHAALRSLVHRLEIIPMSVTNYNQELDTIIQIAINNGYTRELVLKMVKKKKLCLAQKELYKAQPNTEEQKWKTLTYTGYTSEKIKRSIKKEGVRITTINRDNLGKSIVNSKTKINPGEKSGIYKIQCNDCDAIYIGKTRRALKTRVREHTRSIANQKKYTGLAEHCIENQHSIKEDDVKLLHTETNNKKLTLMEYMEIERALKLKQNIVNNQTEIFTGHTPLIRSIKPQHRTVH